MWDPVAIPRSALPGSDAMALGVALVQRLHVDLRRVTSASCLC